jgi:putative acetyltransferase
MRNDLKIRESFVSDAPAVERLYPHAFPGEDLLPLVRDLTQSRAIGISLVATEDSKLVGHAILTKCRVFGCSAIAALLGPVAVAPAFQRRGVGSALIRFGLQRMEAENVALVCVLGDPAYYGRLGFAPESHVEPPFQLPSDWTDAWQSQYLDNSVGPCVGRLTVPPPWMRRELWTP